MKKILFPTDFSEVAERAFRYALNLAKQMNASITTLHAYQRPDVGDFVLPTSLERFYEGIDLSEFENYREAMPTLRAFAEEMGLSSVPLNHAMVEGETVKSIVKVAADEGYDLIVMGTGGASVIKELLFGTVAGEVMEHAQCPVLTVPENANFDGIIDTIAVTIAYSEEDGKILRHVLKFAQVLDAKVEAVHVDITHTGKITKTIEVFKEAFAHFEQLKFTEIEGNSVVDTMANYANTHEIDLIAMVTHQRSFLVELFNYSHAKQMTYQYEVPILAIPQRCLDL